MSPREVSSRRFGLGLKLVAMQAQKENFDQVVEKVLFSNVSPSRLGFVSEVTFTELCRDLYSYMIQKVSDGFGVNVMDVIKW